MKMKRSHVIGVVSAVVMGAAGIGLIVKFFVDKPETPADKVTLWICLAEDVPHEFDVKVKDLGSFPNGVVCPVCGSEDVHRAMQCPECGHYIPTGLHGATPETCMFCGAELAGGKIDTFHSKGGH
ncbi:MAG TPA: hypothetical protein ENJ00_06890 [Phycisphaerales bacterium]|nr:hypothetical protein [Phycisphaerales bacterium]